MKTITIIDDNPIDACLLNNWVTTYNNYKVAHIYHCGVDAKKDCNHINADFCIIDVCMPLLNGFDTATLLIKKGFKGKILLVSHAYCPDYLSKSKNAGAHAYCYKDKNVILSTLAKLELQSNYFDNEYYYEWEEFTQKKNLHKKDSDGRIALVNPNFKKILLYSAQGLTAHDIGLKMNLKKHTIDQYRRDLLQQLGFKNITQAVAWAFTCHIINHSEVLNSTNAID